MVDGVLGQLGRAVKAIDSISIGVTRVSSSLTAVALFKSALRADVSHYDCVVCCYFVVVVVSCCHVDVLR